jgi:hypothetical protein
MGSWCLWRLGCFYLLHVGQSKYAIHSYHCPSSVHGSQQTFDGRPFHGHFNCVASKQRRLWTLLPTSRPHAILLARAASLMSPQHSPRVYITSLGWHHTMCSGLNFLVLSFSHNNVHNAVGFYHATVLELATAFAGLGEVTAFAAAGTPDFSTSEATGNSVVVAGAELESDCCTAAVSAGPDIPSVGVTAVSLGCLVTEADIGVLSDGVDAGIDSLTCSDGRFDSVETVPDSALPVLPPSWSSVEIGFGFGGGVASGFKNLSGTPMAARDMLPIHAPAIRLHRYSPASNFRIS